MTRVLEERMARGFATSLDRLADGLLPIRASGTTVELQGGRGSSSAASTTSRPIRCGARWSLPRTR